MSSPTRPNPLKRVILEGYILPYKYIIGPVTKILLLFTLVICPAFQIAFYSIHAFQVVNYTTKVSMFETVHLFIVIIILSLKVFMVLFGFNTDYFTKFISTIELLSNEFNSTTVGTIKRNRRLNLNIFVPTFICYGILSMIYILPHMQKLGISKVTFLIIDESLIVLGSLFLHNMVCNICICLRAAFSEINAQIASLKEASNELSNLFHGIRNLRKRYSHAVRSTQNAEKLFRCFITLFYVEYFSQNIVNIVRLFGPQTKIEPIFLLAILIRTVHLLILTYNLVSVNNLSRQGMEDLYELSFKLNSIHLYHENDIFIARMALSDVGFTFANLFTINNSFITSMFTLSLTIIIALASFIYN
uniref:Gustatory receptor n=1 Tax=Tetranychus urticae TaxID=32264 RepID=A0A158P551_TETUR